MKEVTDVKCFKEYVERLTLGIARVLERLPGVTDVRFVERPPAEKHCLLSWEQKNLCVLPDDLRDFYLTTDGFTLSWSSKLEGEEIPIGCMVINCVAKLCLLTESTVFSLPCAPTLADLDSEKEPEGSGNHPTSPHFDSRSRIFELDPCSGNGKVCLVYKNCTPVITVNRATEIRREDVGGWVHVPLPHRRKDQLAKTKHSAETKNNGRELLCLVKNMKDRVGAAGMLAEQSELWFLDRSLYWHHLTSSFMAYYRLMISHLGLPEWQYTFTSYGPSPQAKQWACLYQPFTFQCSSHINMAGDLILNKLDPSRAFWGKMKQQVQKKKTPGQSGGSSGGSGTGGIQKGSGRRMGMKR